LQLRRRLESIRRIHQASDELEDRIAELEQARDVLVAQLGGLSAELEAIDDLVLAGDALPLAANSEAA
jgi:cystathionine beta-lyase/cystathionine gamma-synthase